MKLMPIEMPPSTFDDMSDYLIRQWEAVNTSLFTTQIYEPRTIPPIKPRIGQVIYFPAAILPDITEEGLWLYKSTGWTLIA
jgi:hypothetical protein